MVACSGGRLSVAQMLIARGAKVSYTAADDASFGAFDQAKRRPDVVKWLRNTVGLQTCSDSIEVYAKPTKESDQSSGLHHVKSLRRQNSPSLVHER